MFVKFIIFSKIIPQLWILDFYPSFADSILPLISFATISYIRYPHKIRIYVCFSTILLPHLLLVIIIIILCHRYRLKSFIISHIKSYNLFVFLLLIIFFFFIKNWGVEERRIFVEGILPRFLLGENLYSVLTSASNSLHIGRFRQAMYVFLAQIYICIIYISI